MNQKEPEKSEGKCVSLRWKKDNDDKIENDGLKSNSIDQTIMNESVISGIFTVIGAIVGVAGTIIATKLSERNSNLKNKLKQMARQVEAYWTLEELYSKEFGKLSNTPQKTVKENFRTKIEESGVERPTMTANKAKEIVKEIG